MRGEIGIGKGENIRTVLSGIKNAPNIYTGLKQAVKNNMKFDDVTVKDRKTNYTYTGDELKKKNLNLKLILRTLYTLKCRYILVEGGADLTKSFLKTMLFYMI